MTTPRLLLVDIDQAECEQLLAAATIGRLGVVVNGRPEIFPLRHAFDSERHEVVFATTERTKLHAALDWPWVAFEVDEANSDDTGGWSVLVVGHAEEITDATEIDRVSRLRGELWNAGAPSHWMRITPEKITGRRVAR
jgi:nitroimidazol reductase NimA-like FMN-containing flavoprotein (pyridoxamine 5'-phosphate oxidase superfamily)